MSINNDLWSVTQDLYLIYCVHKKVKFDEKTVTLRTSHTCQNRYGSIIKSAEYMQKLLTQADWRPSEDLKLEKEAEEKGRNWEVISTELGKERDLCERRWYLLQAVRIHHAVLLEPRTSDNYEFAAPAVVPPAQPEQPPKVSHKRTIRITEDQPQRKKHEFDVFEPLN